MEVGLCNLKITTVVFDIKNKLSRFVLNKWQLHILKLKKYSKTNTCCFNITSAGAVDRELGGKYIRFLFPNFRFLTFLRQNRDMSGQSDRAMIVQNFKFSKFQNCKLHGPTSSLEYKKKHKVATQT